MFDVRGLNIAIELWGVAFCVVGIASTLLFTRIQERFRNVLAVLFVTELLSVGGDALAGIFRGQTGTVAWLCVHIGNFLTFAGGFMVLSALTSYLCDRLDQDGGHPYLTWWKNAVKVIAVLLCALTAAGLFYRIDENNLYIRSDLYWLSHVVSIAVNALNVALVVRNRRKLGVGVFSCLLFCTAAPIVASAVQVFVYGPNFLAIVSVLGLVAIFVEMQSYTAHLLIESTEQLARSRVELAESRIAAMVSQIQPHFLFNALDSIYYLCDEDPSRAQKAIGAFSTYLRANLDSLRRVTPVPIESELDHVRTYLELEKVSMEDLLVYEIDAQAGGFSVPALAVQTLVENAVKHGPGKGAGVPIKVQVRTRENVDCYSAAVIDDGVGFDTSALGKSVGVGIDNTRKRVEAMCGGTLEIESSPGNGTISIIRVPKEQEP